MFVPQHSCHLAPSSGAGALKPQLGAAPWQPSPRPRRPLTWLPRGLRPLAAASSGARCAMLPTAVW